MGIYTATAQVTRAGDPATATLTDTSRETLRGDVLVPDTGAGALDFRPHAPARAITGQVMAIVNGVLLAGQYQVVALNRGTQHGLETGHVLLREGKPARGRRPLRPHRRQRHLPALQGGEAADRDGRLAAGVQDLRRA